MCEGCFVVIAVTVSVSLVKRVSISKGCDNDKLLAALFVLGQCVGERSW
jgi:hypothetical protein